jgi:hypothetical protein
MNCDVHNAVSNGRFHCTTASFSLGTSVAILKLLCYGRGMMMVGRKVDRIIRGCLIPEVLLRHKMWPNNIFTPSSTQQNREKVKKYNYQKSNMYY